MRNFSALVELSRTSTAIRVEGHDLLLTVTASTEVRAIEANLDYSFEVVVDGSRVHSGLANLADGTIAEIIISDVTGDEYHVANSFQEFLSYRNGAFQSRSPRFFYIVRENISSDDTPINDPKFQGYRRALDLVGFLNAIADLPLSASSNRELIFIGSKRLSLAINYSAEDLETIPSGAQIHWLQSDLLTPPHAKQKQLIFKNVLTRLLESSDEQHRFSRLALRFDGLVKAYRADYDAFITDFNFDKRREEVDRKRLAFLQRVANSTSDIWNKLLAIPIGQAIVVSQYKPGIESALVNTALALGAVLFTVIGLIAIAGHRRALADISDELDREQRDLASRYPYDSIIQDLQPVHARLRIYKEILPRVVSLLLLVGLAFSLFAFALVPPMGAI